MEASSILLNDSVVVANKSGDKKWFFLALILSMAFFGLQYLRYINNKDVMEQKEAKLRLKVSAKATKKEKKQKEIEEIKSERKRIRKERQAKVSKF